MKNYLALIIILFGFISNVFAGPGGELIFHTISLNGNSTFSLRAYKGSEYAWLWDENNSKVIFVSEFDHTWNNLVPWNRGFDVPKDENDGEFGAIPWGIIHFTITSGFQIINFTLDLRDEDWCLNNSKYYTADTYVNFDFSQYAEIVFLSQGAPKDVYNPADPTQKAITSSTQEIWTFWSPGSSPYRANFTVPVTLINEVENTTYHYGLLYANGATIPTDTEAYLRLSSAQVNTHTDLIEYSGNNNYSFKWEHSNVQPTSSSSFDLYKSYTRFNSTLTIENKAVKRVFRPVYPLTIKNNLVEAGGISTDIVYFKDPTTTNTYEEKSAGGNGFEKANAFYNLSIEATGELDQKYGAKAKQQIIYNGKTYNYLEGDFTTAGTDFLVTAATTKTAYYKGQLLSNQTNAYSNPSQRRFIQTPDGVKHICYESMNRVWIEHSTDNGTTWYLGNGGKPLSNADSKNPSMSFYGNQIGIVWQEKSGSSFKIKMALFWMSDYSSSLFETIAEDANDYSHNANPVVEWGYNGKVVVVYSGFDLCINPFGGTALKYWYGDATSDGISQLSQCAIAGTDANSINPTITANYSVYTNPFYFHFAWQQVINSNTSKILYCAFYSDQNNNLLGTGITEVSYNSGYSKNYQPRILLRKVNTEYLPFITWLGYRNTPSVATNVITRYKQYGSWSPFSVYGNSSVQSFSINNAGYQYYQDILGLGWSEPVSPGIPVYVNKAVKIGLSSTINTLSTSGKDLQINNSNGLSSMFVNSYKSNALPYNFTLSQPFSSLNKENSMAIFNGREGIVGKNGAQFFFALGDISVDGQTVEFIQIPDSLETNNLATVNNYFESEPVLVNSNSNLTYGVEYGMVDSVLCSSVLKNNGKITFKVELIDDKTNEVLDVFDEVTYSEKDVFHYDNIGYKVNLNGIGERTIRLRLSTSTNVSFDNSLSNRISDQNMLAKTGYRNINYQGKSVVTEYALEQNYPNPFNPSTTIKYQIPASLNPSKGGTLVTLKVYDILGNEVATLINEEKPAGRYEINFNASSLASGVYIYKIQAGSFISSKKMLLLK